jgi:hypothetical protein
VAVLELANRLKASDRELVDLVYFSNRVRAQVLTAAPELKVFTRENMLVILEASGKTLANCEGECEVETGRRLGADLVVSGDVVKVGKNFKLDLRLHETKEGRLLAGSQAAGASVEDLDAAVPDAVAKMLVALGVPTGSAKPSPQGSEAGPPGGAGGASSSSSGERVDTAMGPAFLKAGKAEVKEGALLCDGCSLLIPPDANDFVFEGDVERLAGNAHFYVGWHFHTAAIPGDSGMAALNLIEGAYCAFRGWENKGWWPLTSGPSKDSRYQKTALWKLDDKNRVRIEVRGQSWTAFLNGSRLDGGAETWFRRGAVALGAAPGTLVRWTNLKLERPASPERGPTPPLLAGKVVRGTFKPVPGGHECDGCFVFLDGNFENGTIEVTVEHLTVPESMTLNLGWRMREGSKPGTGAGYGANIGPDGTIGIFRGRDDTWWPMTTGLKPGESYRRDPSIAVEPQRIKLLARGRTWELSVNGRRVDGGEDGEYRFGGVSFSINAQQRVLLRDIKITRE